MYGIPSIVPRDYRIRPWGMGKRGGAARRAQGSSLAPASLSCPHQEEEKMSGSEKAHSGLTRRGFLKTTGAAVGLTALGSLAGCSAQRTDNTLAVTGSNEQIFRGVCRPNCFGFCHLNVHVRDGKIVKTSRAPYNEECYHRICQRGLSHVQRVYDRERLGYPLRRVEDSERGAGEWERITWDEAFSDIANHIARIRKQYGDEGVGFLYFSGNGSATVQQTYNRFKNVLNATDIIISADNANDIGAEHVAGLTFCNLGLNLWEGNEPTDMKNAKTVVVWGGRISRTPKFTTGIILKRQCKVGRNLLSSIRLLRRLPLWLISGFRFVLALIRFSNSL